MAIKTKTQTRPTIDTTGPDGNASAILASAAYFGRLLGFDRDRVENIQAEMMAGDYENLLEVFDKHFGDCVDVLR